MPRQVGAIAVPVLVVALLGAGAVAGASASGQSPAWSPAAGSRPVQDRPSPSSAAPSVLLASLDPATPPGPPYPDPIEGRRVYDQAAVLEPATVAALTETIADIEARSRVEVVVYTQVKPASDTFEEAESDARALMDEWAIGGEGLDRGLVVLLDLDESRCHGQVQLYAGAGYRSSYLSDAERQRIFTDDMLPALRQCDLDTALLAAMERVDAATPAGGAPEPSGSQPPEGSPAAG
jgi:uncharacterized membrane protein YgcG